MDAIEDADKFVCLEATVTKEGGGNSFYPSHFSCLGLLFAKSPNQKGKWFIPHFLRELYYSYPGSVKTAQMQTTTKT